MAYGRLTRVVSVGAAAEVGLARWHAGRPHHLVGLQEVEGDEVGAVRGEAVRVLGRAAAIDIRAKVADVFAEWIDAQRRCHNDSRLLPAMLSHWLGSVSPFTGNGNSS